MNFMVNQMNKLQKNRKNKNKGFTLVELIIVIAIIAVLAAVLAPQYIKYVENSRISVDENAVSEVVHAAEVAIADETVYDSISASTNVTIKEADGIECTNTTLEDELVSVCGDTFDFKSKAYNGKTYTFTITYTAATSTSPASVKVNAGSFA